MNTDSQSGDSSHELLRLMLEAMPSGIVVIEASGKIVMVNGRLETLFGYSREEMVGQPIEMLVPERFRATHVGYRNGFLANPQARPMGSGRNLFARRKDGTEFPVEIGLNPIETSEGLFVLGTIVDITERQQAEQDLRRSRDELELRVQARTKELQAQRRAALNLAQDADEAKRRVQRNEEELRRTSQELARSNQELEQFAYIASHDLQEPLRKVQSFGDLLTAKAGAALGEEERDYLKRMQGAAQRMQGLINDLLAFARVTSQAKPFVPVDLMRIVREVLADLEARVKSSGGRVDIGDLPQLESDSLQMRQLLQNLIGNALKFHRPDVAPAISVAGRVVKNGNGVSLPHSQSDHICEITVRDNGIGFDEKYLDRIFLPFQRLHGRGEYEGTGMGLAICRKIVERHGGTLTARSTPGQGATFIALIPLRQPKGKNHDA